MPHLPTKPADASSWPADGLEYLGHCPVCGSERRSVLYEGLTDRLFGAPGQWTLYRCRECESGYLDPRPDRNTIGLAYQSYETHRTKQDPLTRQGVLGSLRTRLRNGYLNCKYQFGIEPTSSWGYGAMHLLPPPFRHEWDHHARHLAKPSPGACRLLDVGCGNGEFLARARNQGWNVFGVDFDSQALQHAAAQGIDAFCGDIEDAKLPDESFDAITSHQVIEHVHDPAQFVRTLRRLLKPGGSLWIGTPNFSSNAHQRFGRDWASLQAPAHLQLFSPTALEQILLDSGLSDIRFRPRGFFEHYVHRVSSAMQLGGEGHDNLMIQSRTVRYGRIAAAISELHAWLSPRTGGDMVVTASRP